MNLPLKVFFRVCIHLFSGGVLIATAGLSYYSISAFEDDSSQPDAPASLLAWCMFTPTFLIMSYLANHHMITDPLLPAAIRIFFLLLELIMMLIVIGVSSDNPVFACHITECTYAKLPPPEYTDQISSTWNPESIEATLALFYFFFGYFFFMNLVKY